jgi:hypothetical protein
MDLSRILTSTWVSAFGKRAGDGLGVGFRDGRSLLFGDGDGFVVNLEVDHLTVKGVLQMIAIFLSELDGAVEGAEDPPGSGLAVVQDVRFGVDT